MVKKTPKSNDMALGLCQLMVTFSLFLKELISKKSLTTTATSTHYGSP